MEKKNILVFFGGKSFEHDISIITAVMMIKNYKHGKYNLLPVYISKNNEWFFYSKNEIDVKLFKDFENTYKAKGFIPAYFKNGVNSLFFKSKLFEKKIEVYGALNCCHGGIGEDGNLSSFMKVCNIPLSTGNSVSMGICMDKYVSKLAFDGLKIKNLPYVMMEKDFDEMKKKEAILSIRKIGFPVIIKPASLGSSIGISLAYNEEELHSGLALAFEFDSSVLIEKAVVDQMKEYNIACLRSKDKILVSEADEAVKSDEILSFKDKYIGNDIVKDKTGKKPQKKCRGYLTAKKDFPAKIPESLRKKLQNMSTYIYGKLKLSGPVRIDFIVDKKNKVYLNEINTVPGSLAYYFFIPYFFKNLDEFIDDIIDTSVGLLRKENQVKKEYITNLIN